MWKWLFAFGIGLLAFAPRVAVADDLAVAREQFERCKTLNEKGKACKAVQACEKGLAAKQSRALEKLTEEVRAACKAEKRAQKRASLPACPEGQTYDSETGEHCCWPGQLWRDGACVGTPALCPQTHIVADDQCVIGSCVEPLVREQSGHCCWPGQVFSLSAQACIGKPACPEGYVRDESTCLDDHDGDGVLGARDLCPAKPEDSDGFEDGDGCPEADNDNDGFLDEDDQCTDQAEDFDGFLDDDGCPELDNDNDSYPDDADQCPNAAEDVDGYLDSDGCPDEDNDSDGVADNIDSCPDDAEDFDTYEDADGCPEDGSPNDVLRIGGWIGVGSGVALAASGVALFTLAADERAKAEGLTPAADGLVDSINQRDAFAAQDDANAFDTIGVVLTSAAGVAIAAGVVLLVVDITPETDPDGGGSLEANAGPGSVSLRLRW